MSIIKVENLSKKYLIKHESARYITLRDRLANPLSSLKKALANKSEEFWALKDLSFELNEGEVLGIIGSNGSGKSTLLKILSRITPPTSGRAFLHGRVSSLLEVGTGFHAELSGRENIFLSGVILGMTKKEIIQRFDEIVSFAGIEKFLDTPVKYYSSGMGVRLGFAIAAHLNSDILIIDEVLAVGDAEFQKKCLSKINDITRSHGRTILFVSHGMSDIQKICSRAVLLNNGQLVFDGPVNEVISHYLNYKSATRALVNKPVFISELVSKSESLPGSFSFEVRISSKVSLPKVYVGIGINDISGRRITTLFSKWTNQFLTLEADNSLVIICQVNNLFLNPGSYSLDTTLCDDYEVLDTSANFFQLQVSDQQSRCSGYVANEAYGPVFVDQQWLQN